MSDIIERIKDTGTLYKLDFKYMNKDVHINLKEKQTVLCGDSGSGKSYIYYLIDRYAKKNVNENVLCIDGSDITSKNKGIYKNFIKNMKNGLIVIDNADVAFENEDIKQLVWYDKDNFYIIIARNYMYKVSELAEPLINGNSISIEYCFNEYRG